PAPPVLRRRTGLGPPGLRQPRRPLARGGGPPDGQTLDLGQPLPGGGPLPAGRDAVPAQGSRRRSGALRRGGPAVARELGLPAPGPTAGRSRRRRRARRRAWVLEV